MQTALISWRTEQAKQSARSALQRAVTLQRESLIVSKLLSFYTATFCSSVILAAANANLRIN